jgi:Protein of unknown function (DUF2802)
MSIEALRGIPPELWWWWGRSALILLAFAIFAWALIRERRGADALRREFARELADSRRLLADFAERLAAMGTAMAMLAAGSDSERAMSSSPPAKAPPVRSGYEIAIRLARSGASVDELMASSGTTRPEAELLKRLHGSEAATRDAGHNPRTASPARHAQS